MKRLIGILCVFGLMGCGGLEEGSRTEMVAEQVQDCGGAIVGRCHCGDISYEAAGPVVKSSYCDCAGCRRATGTLKVPFVTVQRAGFSVTKGQPMSFRAASGVQCDAHGTWHFCGRCGSPLFWKGHQGEELDLFAGTLDDGSVFQPQE